VIADFTVPGMAGNPLNQGGYFLFAIRAGGSNV
jgi:hypothetical protein